MVNRMANYSVFSTFDLKYAYHQVEISPEDRIYTAFAANGSLYEFKTNSMSVTNGVLKFQRAVDKVAEVEDLEGTFPYKDNVTVLTRKTMMRMCPDSVTQQRNIT